MRRSGIKLVPSAQRIRQFPFTQNLYRDYPKQEIGINEFETYALDRLQLLKAIENAQFRSTTPLSENSQLNEVIKKYMPLNCHGDGSGTTVEVMYNQRKKDYISHFILRLAYCQTDDLREWFIRQESQLFQIRWDRFKEKSEFIMKMDMNMDVLSDQEKMENKSELMDIIYQKYSMQLKNENEFNGIFEKEIFYKIPFEQVADLVQRRVVYINKGTAYVPSSEQLSLILNEFKKNLRDSMEYLAGMLTKMDNDERLTPILSNLSKQYTEEAYVINNTNGEIKPNDIPSVSRYFPLCMQHLKNQLDIDGHLRNGGRMQYGLFLKGIGLTMEDSLTYWRRAFNKMSDDQFNKNYAYNIRHTYGKEGKHTNYSPYSCAKIIMSNHPSSGDHHGCPFRHASTEVLAHMLKRSGIKENNIGLICSMAKDRHYQLACSKMLEITSGMSNELLENISHPNKYFEQCYPNSQKYQQRKQQSTSTNSSTEDVIMSDSVDYAR